jgi:hypothetical protein
LEDGRRAQTLCQLWQPLADQLGPRELAAVAVKQDEPTEHVEEGGGVREPLAQILRALQVLQQRICRVPSGLRQGDRIKLAQPEFVAGALGGFRQLGDQAKGGLETRDDVPKGMSAVVTARGLLQKDDGLLE